MGFYRDWVAPRLTHLCCGAGRIRHQRSKIVPESEGIVVEIGMGTGHNLALYRPDRVRRVIGVEPHAAMTDLARNNLGRSPVPVEVRPGFAEDLPLDDNSADTAVLTFTLCSVADAERALVELRRVLKPSGRLLMLEHGLAEDENVARWQQRVDPVWSVLAVGCHINRPMTGLVEEAGFAFQSRETFYLPGAPRVVGWHTRGLARVR